MTLKKRPLLFIVVLIAPVAGVAALLLANREFAPLDELEYAYQYELFRAGAAGEQSRFELFLLLPLDSGRGNSYANPPLVNLASSGSDGAVLSLLEHGANVNVRDKHGWSALFAATRGRHVSTVRILLEHGADSGAIAGYGTALDEAIEACDLTLIELLGRARGAACFEEGRAIGCAERVAKTCPDAGEVRSE